MSKTIELGAHDTCVILRGNGETEVVTSDLQSQVAKGGARVAALLVAVAGSCKLLALVDAVRNGGAAVEIVDVRDVHRHCEPAGPIDPLDLN